MTPTFSIITPCYNANRWIRSCVDSVADQQGVSVQHLIQDGLSTDGTAEYVLAEPRVQAESKKDSGMYDAINQGWARATGEFVLHLNADEQLLPGALALVGSYFQSHPDVDVVLGGTLICDPDGSLLCYRKALRPPMSILLTSHHPVHSSGIFFRRSALRDRAWLYNPTFRIIGDLFLMIDIVRAGTKMAVLDCFTSVFFMTGENLGLIRSATAIKEDEYRASLSPGWMQVLAPVFKISFHLQKFFSGHYSRRPISYDLYLPDERGPRRRFFVARPSGVFRPHHTSPASSHKQS